MKVHHTLICFFFLALQDGNAEVNSAHNISFGVIGGNLTAEFSISDRKWKMLCREECKGERILINTTDKIHQHHRYSMNETTKDYAPALTVNIPQLIMSDAGQYRCGGGESPSSVTYTQFEVVVAEALLDGNDDPAQLKHFYKEPGSSLTVGCYFKQSGNIKTFCRGECGEDEVLVQTYGADDFNDRYRIGSRGSSRGGVILYVSITQLTKSDSGQYRCYLNGTSDQDSFRVFEVTVTDAVISSTSSPSLTSSVTTEQSERRSEDVSLFVGLTVAVIIIVFIIILSVLIFCKKTSAKPKNPPVETQYAAVTEANVVYEEIRDDCGQKGAALVEISSVYTLAKFINTPESTDDYSMITAPTFEPSAEADSGNLTKSELKASKTDVDSPSSAPPEPRADTDSDPSQSRENPLYSTKA